MDIRVTVLIILIALFAVLVAVFLFRLHEIRQGGTPVVVRKLPASPGQGWHHGVLRYRDTSVVFYRLTSLLPGPSNRISRQSIDVGARRAPIPAESDIIEGDVLIVEVSDGADRFEVALERRSITAFLSWVESRPSGRSQRRRPSG